MMMSALTAQACSIQLIASCASSSIRMTREMQTLSFKPETCQQDNFLLLQHLSLELQGELASDATREHRKQSGDLANL